MSWFPSSTVTAIHPFPKSWASRPCGLWLALQGGGRGGQGSMATALVLCMSVRPDPVCCLQSPVVRWMHDRQPTCCLGSLTAFFPDRLFLTRFIVFFPFQLSNAELVSESLACSSGGCLVVLISRLQMCYMLKFTGCTEF